MKLFRKILILILIIEITGSCALSRKTTEPKLTVKHLSESGGFTDGSIVYALPMSVITIRIETEKETALPGPYSAYAGELLGLEDVITMKDEKWRITGVSVISHEEADPSEFYVIETEGILRANALALRREGLILDLNPGSVNERTILASSGADYNDQFRSYDLGSDEYYITITDTAYRRLTMDSQFVRVPYIVEKKRKLTEAELAERAARRLMDIREGKILILTGEANVFPQSAAAIDEMNRMEEDYLELFTGKRVREKRTFTYQFIPSPEHSGKKTALLKFSEEEGPADLVSEQGDIVYIELIPEKKTKDLVLISQTTTLTEPDPVEKLFYRIPDIAIVNVVINDKILCSSRKMIYQLGQIIQLPGNFVSGK